MARPSQTRERRKQLLPVIARTFAEFGYRRTTTAELAQRCEVRENILYRLWPDKKAMFVAAIEYVYQLSAETWAGLLRDEGSGGSAAERLLDYESEHHGELGLYRLVFAGLSEIDDPQIRGALQKMYGRFHRFIHRQIAAYRGNGRQPSPAGAELAAWAIVGLGTVANIGRELGLTTPRKHKRLIKEVGRLLLEG